MVLLPTASGLLSTGPPSPLAGSMGAPEGPALLAGDVSLQEGSVIEHGQIVRVVPPSGGAIQASLVPTPQGFVVQDVDILPMKVGCTIKGGPVCPGGAELGDDEREGGDGERQHGDRCEPGPNRESKQTAIHWTEDEDKREMYTIVDTTLTWVHDGCNAAFKDEGHSCRTQDDRWHVHDCIYSKGDDRNDYAYSSVVGEFGKGPPWPQLYDTKIHRLGAQVVGYPDGSAECQFAARGEWDGHRDWHCMDW